MHVQLADLPAPLRSLLNGELSYRRADIELRISETVTPGGCTFEGNRGYLAALNLATGESRVTWGSWSGSNHLSQTLVDDLREPQPIPAGVVFVSGETGGRGSFARLVARPETLAKALPAVGAILSDHEAVALYAHKGLKGGHHRAEHMARHGVPASAVESLVARGLLKENARGARQITTDGRNALEAFALGRRRAGERLPAGVDWIGA